MGRPVGESYLHWLFMALGPKYVLLLPLAGLAALALSLVVVVRGRGPLVGAALVFIVPMPFLIGLYGTIEGAMAVSSVLAAGEPKGSELASGMSLSLATLWVGTLLMAPAYCVAVVGLFVRSLIARSDAAQAGPRC